MTNPNKKPNTPSSNLDILEKNLRWISEEISRVRAEFHNARAAEVRTPQQVAQSVRADLRDLSRDVEDTLDALRFQIDDGRFGV